MAGSGRGPWLLGHRVEPCAACSSALCVDSWGQVSWPIKNGSIRSVDLANGTITTADIPPGAVDTTTIADGTIAAADLAASAQPAGIAFADGEQPFFLDGFNQSIRSVVLNAPGHVAVTSSGYFKLLSSELDRAKCTITDGDIAQDTDNLVVFDDVGIETSTHQTPLSMTRTFAAPAGATTFHLVCSEIFGSVLMFNPQITALYVPALYAP